MFRGDAELQRITTLKRIAFYRRDAIRNCNAGQTLAPDESQDSNTDNAVRNYNAGQTLAPGESPISDTDNAVRDDDAGQAGMLSESKVSYRSHLFPINRRRYNQFAFFSLPFCNFQASIAPHAVTPVPAGKKRVFCAFGLCADRHTEKQQSDNPND